jgi:flagellar biosynthesis chaperone FliJ
MERDRQLADMKRASSNVTAAYETFLAARRAREMVDKNRDAQLRAHNLRVNRSEQNELDDLASRDCPSPLAPSFHPA